MKNISAVIRPSSFLLGPDVDPEDCFPKLRFEEKRCRNGDASCFTCMFGIARATFVYLPFAFLHMMRFF